MKKENYRNMKIKIQRLVLRIRSRYKTSPTKAVLVLAGTMLIDTKTSKDTKRVEGWEKPQNKT